MDSNISFHEGKLVRMSAIDIQTDYYFSNYDIIANYSCITQNGAHKMFIDNEINKPYVCRFCGKRNPVVKFNDNCHAISEMLGNKVLFIKSECECCNKRFGRKFENQLANYLNPIRTLSQTKGKNGVPSYKTLDEKSRIDVTEKGVVIQESEGSEIVCFKNDEIILKLQRKKYTPLLVYKALVFMALSIIPDNELTAFKETIEWLNEDDLYNSKYNMNSYSSCVIERFFEGEKPLNVHAVVVRRKIDRIVPYAFFILEFDNISFQIIIPCLSKDKQCINQKIEFHLFPTSFDENPNNDGKKRGASKRDFSSVESINDDSIEIALHNDYSESIAADYSNLQSIISELGVKPIPPKSNNDKS